MGNGGVESNMPRERNWPITRRSCVAATAASWLIRSTCMATEPSLKWPYEVEAGIFRIHADFEISSTSQFIHELEQFGY